MPFKMKRKYTFLVLATGICLGFLFGFAADKLVTIKFSDTQLNYHWKNLQNIKAIADQSNLPHAQVKFVMGAIDSLQSDIAVQVRPQLEPQQPAAKK